MTEKKIEITAELREGVSTKTNQPYRFYTYYVIVNGVHTLEKGKFLGEFGGMIV